MKTNRMFRVLWFFIYLTNIHSAPYSCPDLCNCNALDASTTCRRNGLIAIPAEVFLEVQILDLSYNNFSSIPKNVSLYTKIQKLRMKHNKINAIDKLSLQGLDNLKELDLSDNRLTWLEIHHEALAVTKSIQLFDLSNNALKGFPDTSHNRLASNSLETLILTNCSITNLHNDILDKLPNLTALHLGENNFKVISNQEIRSEHLTMLNLSNCNLEHIHDASFMDLDSLQYLILSKNFKLKAFNGKSMTLKYLDVSDCNLESVPTVYLPNLQHADFKGNHLRMIQANDFKHSPKLRIINLTYNTIHEVDVDAFRGLKHVYKIDLSYNLINSVDPKTFTSNVKLTQLVISHNYMTEVIKFEIESLIYLDLSGNEISYVAADSLMDLPNLRALNLSRNLLGTVSNRLASQQILNLDLSLCRIKSINNLTFKAMPKLYALNLSGNRLVDIKFSNLHGATDIRLNDNTWRCDCKSTSFKALYNGLSNRMSDLNKLVCHYPENLEGLDWRTACDDVWFTFNNSSRTQRAWTYSIVIALVCCFAFCIIISIRRSKKKRRRAAEALAAEQVRIATRESRIREREIRETAYANAPDPMELQRPPSYAEAVLMPSLHGSLASLASRRSNGSRHNLNNNDIKPKNMKRKRRKSKAVATTSDEGTSARQHDDDADTSEQEPSSLRIFMESNV